MESGGRPQTSARKERDQETSTKNSTTFLVRELDDAVEEHARQHKFMRFDWRWRRGATASPLRESHASSWPKNWRPRRCRGNHQRVASRTRSGTPC